MITHVVLIKLKDQNPENVESVLTVLASLKGKIPKLRHLEVGKNITSSKEAYDIALIAKFGNLDDLNSYD